MSMMTDRYDAQISVNGLWLVRDEHKKTKLDGSFQRYGGTEYGSGWDLDRGLFYLKNLLAGKANNQIQRVDVKWALRYARDRKDDESIEYFEGLLEEGYEFLSVDGHNSSSFITAFMNDDEDIKVITDDVLSIASFDRSSKPKRFSDFSKATQRIFEVVHTMPVLTLRNISIKEVCDMFRNLNESVPLNAQEWRQARWSPLSKFVRDTSNTTSNNRLLFKNFVFNNELDLDKRIHEEMVAKLALKINSKFETDTGAKNLNIFYAKVTDLPRESRNDIESILSNAQKMAVKVGSLRKKMKKGQLHNLFDAIQIATIKNKFDILDHEKFYRWFMESDAKFIVESKNVTEENLEEKSYTYWTRFYSKSTFWNKTRTLLEFSFIEDLQQLKDDGVVRLRRTSKQAFSFQQKLVLLQKQNGITRKGEHIDIIDLYRGKYEADHVVSVKAGGETTIVNGEVMKREDNRSKGSKSNEPHFPHQRQ